MTINHLKNIIGTSQRTVYRYLDLIEELGFELNKNFKNQYFIEDDSNTTSTFSEEEASYLKTLLLTAGKDSLLNDSILKKIQITSEVNIATKLTLKAHLGKNVSQISEAINLKNQIIIKDYHSLSSNNISDRIVEPISFTDNYEALIAFEVEAKKTKIFKTERINSVEILEKSFKHKDEHIKYKPDAFGFAPKDNGKQFDIKLKMNLKAYLLMKEEYPQTLNYIDKHKDDKHYQLEMKVNSLKPIIRFCDGLKDEIEFIDNLKEEKSVETD